jgi:hypothetical protein
MARWFNGASWKRFMARLRFRAACETDLAALLEMKIARSGSGDITVEREFTKASLTRLMRNPDLGSVWLIQQNREAIGYCILLFSEGPSRNREAMVDELYVTFPVRIPDVLGKIKAFLSQVCRSHGIRILHEKIGRQAYLKTTWLT